MWSGRCLLLSTLNVRGPLPEQIGLDADRTIRTVRTGQDNLELQLTLIKSLPIQAHRDEAPGVMDAEHRRLLARAVKAEDRT